MHMRQIKTYEIEGGEKGRKIFEEYVNKNAKGIINIEEYSKQMKEQYKVALT